MDGRRTPGGTRRPRDCERPRVSRKHLGRYDADRVMEREIDLASLKGIAILFDNDLHDLGKFVLRAFDARWAGTGSKARPTLYGLAGIYGRILDCPSGPFEEAIRTHGLPLGAAVGHARKARALGAGSELTRGRRRRS